MKLTSVLTALGLNEHDTAGARAAAIVATAHEAHLIGLHVIDIPILPGYLTAEVPAEVYEIQDKVYRDAASSAEARFLDVCKEAGIDGEWRCVEGRARDVIQSHARYVDLLCLSGAKDGEFTLPEDLLLGTGKPVLVCPVEFGRGTIGERVVIAWDESREAARTVTDALGLLQRASRVSVVTAFTDPSRAQSSAESGAELCRYLALHGVTAEHRSIDAVSISVGDALLEWSQGEGADLLVMGAYGHSRFREVILGGSTRSVLRQAHLPLLMSH